MGFALAYGTCIGCNQPFSFNPMRVPSMRVTLPGGDSVREPICAACVERANPKRIENGLQPIVPHPEAYEACDENELPYDD